jgi:tetratricopeptide (TPR) repeat protein
MIMQDPIDDDKIAQIDAELFQIFIEAMDTALAGKRDTPVAKQAASEALFCDSLEASTDEEEWDLLTHALDADPGNVDALLTLLDYLVVTVDEEIAALRKIVALGERRLGKKGFKAFAGNFWLALETRPYMRARAWLADALHEAGKTEDALAEREALLSLNPGDNQGIRHVLLPTYLENARLDDASRLLGAHKDECGAHTVFAWCRALERFLCGDEPGAQAAVAGARKQNGFTEAYLVGHRKSPKLLPDAYAAGSKEEAECFADSLNKAWGAHPSALKWLAAQPKAGK